MEEEKDLIKEEAGSVLPVLTREKGSRLNRTEPENRTGSCGMIARALLSLLRATAAMSAPSMRMRPSTGSAQQVLMEEDEKEIEEESQGGGGREKVVA